jgi:hypothetical protein
MVNVVSWNSMLTMVLPRREHAWRRTHANDFLVVESSPDDMTRM